MSGPGWSHKGKTFGSPNEVIEHLEAENAKLQAAVEALKTLNTSDLKVAHEKNAVLILQNDELRKALSQLVKDIEDTWRHGGRCLIGTDEQEPETECECGADIIDGPLGVLARIRPSTEKRITEPSKKCPACPCPHDWDTVKYHTEHFDGPTICTRCGAEES